MTTIMLTPELEKVTAEQAREMGTTLELLALNKLTEAFLPLNPISDDPEGETMADFLRDYIGCIDSREVVPGGANMSEFTGRKFGERLKEKQTAGNLRY